MNIIKQISKKVTRAFFLSFFLISSIASAQYCTGTLGGAGCAATDQITGVEIPGTSLWNLTNTCTGTTTNTQTIFVGTPNVTATLVQGQLYIINVTTSANNIISLWIDYDHSLTFDANEWVQICTGSTPGGTTSASFTVPAGGFIGETGMRIRSRLNGNQNGAPDACLNFGSGETEDYLVTIDAGSPCVAPPTAGTAQISAASVCPGKTIVCSIQGNSIGSGQTYQWESSPDNIVWTPITGATNSSFVDTINALIYYHCILTCSGQTATTNSVSASVNPPSQCYCVSGLGGGGCTAGNLITAVSISGTNFNSNGNNCTSGSGGTLTVFPDTGSATTTLTQGITYGFNVTTDANNIISVWIDYDQNGSFDPSEWTQIATTSTSGLVNTASITIPFTALLGKTGMRVRSRASANPNGAPDACLSFGSGEAEDYSITIGSGLPCVAPPTAGIAVVSSNLVCAGSIVQLSLSGNSVGLGQTYQWQYSFDNINWSDIVGATNSFASDSIIAATYYQCIVTCSGSVVASSSVQVTLKSATLCYCASSATNSNDDDIGWFELGSLKTGGDTTALLNPYSVRTYSDFTMYGATPLSQGATYPIKVVQINSSATFYICTLNVYLDYDQNGIYDSTEVIFTDTTSAGAGGNLLQGSVTIPANAPIGNTGLRAVLSETNPVQPCGTYSYGETEDYLIYIDYPLGILSGSQNFTLSAIPNPATNRLTLSFVSNETENAQLKLVNMNGQMVYAETLNHFSGKYSKTLDVSTFAKGIYNLQLQSSKGISNKKVVIE